MSGFLAGLALGAVGGASVGAMTMAMLVAGSRADQHADATALARQHKAERSNRVWSNIPSTPPDDPDEHVTHMGAC